MKLKYSNFNISRNKINAGLAFLLLCLLVIVFIRGRIGNPAGVPPEPNPLANIGEVEPLVVEDISQLVLASLAYKLPDTWVINASLNSDSGINYRCELAGCKLVLLAPTQEEILLPQVVFSTPHPVLPRLLDPGVEPEVYPVEWAGENVDLTAGRKRIYQLQTDAQGVDQELGSELTEIVQVTGCNKEKLCVFAMFDLDRGKNIQQLSEFKQLLANLQKV